MKIVKIRNSKMPFSVVNVKVCDTFFSRFLGLMFSRKLEQDEGIILVEKKESRINATIHMMFMNYDITVLWLDEDMVIVDKVLAKKWAPMVIPKKPAQFIMELHHTKFGEYSIGDRLMEMN